MEEKINPTDLLDTTDCLEAVGVFRGWKNFFFVIVVICLLLQQGSFWLLDTGYVKTNSEIKYQTAGVGVESAEKIKEAVKQAVEDANQPAKVAPQESQQQKSGLPFSVNFEQLAWLIRIFNFVLIIAAILYCLTMLFTVKVSLLGKLGGINHISRAFFLSLVALVLLLPWQRFFGGVVVGVIYTPEELLSSFSVAVKSEIIGRTFYYLHFCGYWVVMVLLLIFAQIRSARWTKAMLRRLKVA